MKHLNGAFRVIAAGIAVLVLESGAVQAESYVLPSSAYRAGANAAEYRTDVRLLNQGTSSVTVTATFYDQATSTTFPASPFPIQARSQVAFDNILQSLFGKTLSQGAYGPIRFDATGPILVAANVNNVNACGAGAVSGQWLPAIPVSQALSAGVIGQLAVSSNTGSGYRTNLVFMNPGSAAATVTVKVRQGGSLLSTGTIGPLTANGFSQVALDSGVFPGVAGTTNTNLWLEFSSDQPVLAYATMINNASGDPFAVVASSDTPTANPFAGSYSGSYTGSDSGTWTATVSRDGTISLGVISGTVGGFSGIGTMSQTGDSLVTTGGHASGIDFSVTWTGRFLQQGAGATGSGTWASTTGGNGTWSGARQ